MINVHDVDGSVLISMRLDLSIGLLILTQQGLTCIGSSLFAYAGVS